MATNGSAVVPDIPSDAAPSLRKIAVGAGAGALGGIVAKVLNLVSVLALARYFGPEDFGVYSYVTVFAGMFMVVADLGLYPIIVRELAAGRVKAASLIGNALVLRVGLGLLALGCVAVAGMVIHVEARVLFLMLLTGVTLPLSATQVYGAVMHARFRLDLGTLIGIVASLLSTVAILGVVFLRADLSAAIVAGILVAPAVAGAGFMWTSRQWVRPSFRLDPALMLRLLKPAIALSLSGAFVSIYMRIDQVLVFNLLGAREVGIYSAAVRLVEMPNFLASALMSAVFPALSHYFGRGDATRLSVAYRYALRLTSGAAVPAAVGLAVAAGPLIDLTFGTGYGEGRMVLVALAGSLVWVILGVACTQMLIATGNQRAVVVGTVSAGVLNIALNLALIPAFGIVGSAIATTASYAVSQLAMLTVAPARPYMVAAVRSLIRPTIAAIPMAIVGAILLDQPLWIMVPVCVLTYALAILPAGIVTRSELRPLFPRLWLRAPAGIQP